MYELLESQNVQRKRIAVCLAAYNGMAYIVEQIESILLQKNVELQLFISVDQSSDGTEDRLSDWARSEPRLTLLPFGQHFGGAGPNFYRLLREVDLSGFDYLSFADQDDIWHPEKLWRAHSLMTAQNAVGYSSNFTAFWPSGEARVVNKARPQRTWDFLFESAGPGCTYVLHSSVALPLQQLVRNADTKVLRVDYHDWLTYAFARSHNYSWVIDSWSSMQYRQHAHNQIGVNAGWRSFWLRVRKILNGYGFEQSLLIADLVQASALPVVQRGLRGGRLGYLWLALRATQCRRKRIDQMWFFISCVLLAFFKPADRGDA
ncbi:MAG TPA: glycosyltransferase [Rhodoferax sp.]